MSTEKQRTSHLTHEEYLAVAQLLDEEISKTGSVDQVLASQVGNASRQFGKIVRGIGEAMASIDRTVGQADEYEVAVTNYAVLNGALAGLAIARFAYEPRVFNSGRIFDSVEIANIVNDDELQYKHELSAQFRELGWEGMKLVGDDAEEIIERWEQKLIPDVTKQSLFRIGSGIVLAAARADFQLELDEQAREDLQNFSRQVDGAADIDWDAELGKL